MKITTYSRINKHDVQLDALTICYRIKEDFRNDLMALEIGQALYYSPFMIKRVKAKGKDFYYYIFMDKVPFACIKFSFMSELNNGTKLAWITANNDALYNGDYRKIESFAEFFNLEFNNYSCIDICLDTNKNTARQVKKMLHDKDITPILNGKALKDRNEHIPELIYTTSGTLNDHSKSLTITVKQRKALKNKCKGASVTLYDKLYEIEHVSHKDYIKEHYGSPRFLYRTEVHLNNKEIREFEDKAMQRIDVFNIDKELIEALFFSTLDSVLRFRQGRKTITWRDILRKPKRQSAEKEKSANHKRNKQIEVLEKASDICTDIESILEIERMKNDAKEEELSRAIQAFNKAYKKQDALPDRQDVKPFKPFHKPYIDTMTDEEFIEKFLNSKEVIIYL